MKSTSRTVRVVKVGGSLFDYEDLAAELARFLDLQPPATTVLIAGGGVWADAIREVDANSRIGERVAHDLCIRAMGTTARLLAAMAPQYTLESCWERLRAWTRSPHGVPGTQVFEVAGFLADVEPQSPGQVLPHDWSVTSDSIAARVAGALSRVAPTCSVPRAANHESRQRNNCYAFAGTALEATELVLVKSAPLTHDKSMHQAAAEGYVDRFFPRTARELRCVRCVNLRDPKFPETVWGCRTQLADWCDSH